MTAVTDAADRLEKLLPAMRWYGGVGVADDLRTVLTAARDTVSQAPNGSAK